MVIAGVSGLLGCNLAYYFKRKYDILGLYNLHHVDIDDVWTTRCDLGAPEHLEKIVTNYAPDVIVNCAASADIDLCERDKDLARRSNVDSAGRLGRLANETGAKLIHISTDAVYDGAPGKSAEDAIIRPVNVYGRSKHEAELAVADYPNSLIMRTNFFGWNVQDKVSLGEWALKELKAGCRITGFADAYFSSIYTMELARVLDMAVERDLVGIYNCGSRDCCSKYEFMLKIASVFGLDGSLVEPISIDQSKLRVQRGKDLSLDVSKLEKALKYTLPTIDQSVDSFYRDEMSGIKKEIGHLLKDDVKPAQIIPYGRQSVDNDDVAVVVSVMRSNLLTQGPKVVEFEEVLAGFCGADYAIAMSSGTAALHLGCLALGVTVGDEVITSPNTFVASANCAAYCGAKPIFADIDSKTYNISSKEIEKKITRNTKAVIPVHFAGQSCDMKAIRAVVDVAEKRYGHRIYIIEDASHALGSRYEGDKVGSCRYSDLAVMSFHPVKHVTTGEGGAVLTNDKDLCLAVKKLRTHGITSTHSDFSVPGEHGPWYYEQQELGFNYRITDIQSALGVSQMRKLPLFMLRRREIVTRYNDAFRSLRNVCIPYEAEGMDSNFHLYVLLFDFQAIGIDRAEFMLNLRGRGIGSQVHYIPVHTQPYYRETFGTNWGDCPCAEKYYKKCLSMPIFPTMMDVDVKRVIEAVQEYLA